MILCDERLYLVSPIITVQPQIQVVTATQPWDGVSKFVLVKAPGVEITQAATGGSFTLISQYSTILAGNTVSGWLPVVSNPLVSNYYQVMR